jgi:murein DD-endopeptidase MepM/ murein hydrolase activator NlpD
MKFKERDTLSAIASRHGTTIAKLMAANPSIKNANSIKLGGSYTLPKVSLNNNKTRGGGTYVGRDQLKDTNPYKNTDMKELNKKKTTTADAMTKAGEERTRIVKKYKDKPISTSSANPYPNNMKGGPPQRQGTKEKKSIGSKIMGFIKGEGKKVSSDFDKAVKETKRNFSDKRYFVNGVDSRKKKIKSKSNITNSSSYKGKQNKGNT